MVSLFLYLSTIGQSYASDVLPQFNLVGLYDMATIMNLSKVNGTSFHWVPSKEMNQSCGNAKFPYKMNIMEADAISSGMTPALVVLLRREGAAEYIDRQNNPCSPDKVPSNLITKLKISSRHFFEFSDFFSSSVSNNKFT